MSDKYEVVKDGTFTLRIDTDGPNDAYGSSSHQNSNTFGVKADEVPFVVAPMSKKSYKNYCALVIDTKKETYTYAVVGDVGPDKNGWGEVSLKCAWNLGYTSKQANGKQGPKSNFIIIIFNDSKPKWTNKSSSSKINKQINDEGKKRAGEYKQIIQKITSYNSNTDDDDDNTTTRTYEESQALINTDVIKQYIISINRYVNPNTNFNYMKKNEDVVGAMIEAGFLYDSSKRKQNRYRNPQINEQVRAINRAELPYGLYAISRANSIIESNEEIDELTYLINKYPPLLGMWVRIDLRGKTTAVNDKILDNYRSRFTTLGLRYKIGIIADKKQLSKIHWQQHQDSWLLWYIDRVKDINEVDDKLLTPTFFDI